MTENSYEYLASLPGYEKKNFSYLLDFTPRNNDKVLGKPKYYCKF